jgi:hypothetical protein
MIIFSITMFVVCCAIVLWILLKKPSDDPSGASNWSTPKDPSLGKLNDSSWLKPLNSSWSEPADQSPSQSAWLPKLFSATLGNTNVPTKIVFNGQEFSGPDQMPAEVRRVYDQTMNGVLADANENGIPDVFEGGGSKGVFHVEMKNLTTEDPAEKLKKLKEMKDSGLINDAEYEAKKAEILSRM